MDSYISKLDSVFNLINTDIPDTYDDTLNSKFLDSIKNLMKKHEKLRIYLNDYIEKRIVFGELVKKDDEIQAFFLNLISLTFDLNDDLVILKREDFLDYLKTCSNSYNTIVEYAALDLIFRSFNGQNDRLLEFIKKNYLENLSFFYSKSIFISKLYKNLVQIYVKNLYIGQKYSEIEFYFDEIIKSKSNYEIIFSFFDILYSLYKEFEGNRDIIGHLDGKLKDLIEDGRELNELVSNIKSINSIESYSFVWFKLNNQLDSSTIASITHKFNNYSFLFKFLIHLFKLAGRNNEILNIYLSPINDFRSGNEDGGKYFGNQQHQQSSSLKQSILNSCLLLSSSISPYLTLNSFDLSSINSILKNSSLNVKIKNNLIKLLSSVLINEENNNGGRYYHLYSILYDYSTTLNDDDDDDDLLNIFIIYLNNSTKNENDELIEKQLLNYLLKLNDDKRRKKILNVLINLNNDDFSLKLISNDNFSLIMIVEENEEDELKEDLLKILKKCFKIIPISVFKNQDFILSEQFYLKSNIIERNELIEIIFELCRQEEKGGNRRRKYIDYYSFILSKISNDYYNQDTFDIEIKCLNFILNELDDDEIEILSPNLMKLIQNDYFYSKNSKYNYIKNIRLTSALILLKVKFQNELVRNVKLYCENYEDDEKDDDNDDMNLLNDIISSYEFNMNDNKISDCY